MIRRLIRWIRNLSKSKKPEGYVKLLRYNCSMSDMGKSKNVRKSADAYRAASLMGRDYVNNYWANESGIVK